MWSDRILLWIFRRFPPRPEDVIFRAPPGRPESEYELEATRPFHDWFGVGAEELFGGRDVLDLGSGYGGSAVRFLEYGARRVTGIEISEAQVHAASEFARVRGVDDRVSFALGLGERIPLPDAAFDLVTMYDVMEHVLSPRDVLAECHRVLRPGGTLATVFPPYYDLTAGSHLHGYATSFPGLNLVFSTRQLRSAARKLLDEESVDYERFFREAPADKLWNQNGLTVRGFRRLVAESPFELEMLRLLGHRDPRTRNNNPGASGALAPAVRVLAATAQVPGLREVVCSRVCALLRK